MYDIIIIGEKMKVLNFGSCNIDYVYQLDHIVVPGETQSSTNMQLFAGGKGLNQSIAIARAGAKVYHAGAIGQDGNELLQLLKENNVDVTYLQTVNEKTGHAIIQVAKNGENSIFIHAGANACITTEYIDLVLANFGKDDILLLQNEISNVEYIVNKAFEKQMVIILNPSPINEKIAKIDLKKISYLIVNQKEAQAITNHTEELSALEYFITNYPNLKLILTLGKTGSLYQDNSQRIFQPSYKVDTVDTTAAGDTFTGYFVAGLIKGIALQKNMNYSSCASALSVSKNGAAPSIPTINEVEKALNTLSLNQENIQDKQTKRSIETLIEQNLTNVTMGDIAKHLGYSLVYTGVLVKTLFGKTYKELLLDKRLEKAKQLLTNSKLSIGEIIKTIGYENEGYFRKKFTQKFGKKPLEYRKILGEL